MSSRSGSVALADYPSDVVHLACERCGRRGQYHKATLIRQHGADVALPDLLREIARCERRDLTNGGCSAHYLDLE